MARRVAAFMSGRNCSRPARQVTRIQDSLALAQRRGVPEWLAVVPEGFTGTVKALPTRADLTMPINEKLVVELYSK